MNLSPTVLSPPLTGGPSRPARRGWAWALLIAALAVAFTWGMVRWSYHYGRLRMPMTYDDVTYCLQAAPLLRGWQEKGPAGLVRAYLDHPPHGPLNSLLAAGGFRLFGMKDWAPYATNALFVALCLSLAFYLGRDLRALPRAAMMVFALGPPFMQVGVREFRPDFYAAFFTVAALWLAVERASEESARRRADWLIGAGFGLALLAKPTFFAHTAVMFAASLGVELLPRWRDGIPWRLLWTAAARRALALVVVAGWHYAVNWREVWIYFYTNSFGQTAAVWKMPGSWWAKAPYFWTGPGGQALLGGSLYVLLALTVWGLATSRAAERLRALTMLGLGGLSFFIICSGAHRDMPFFALCSHMVLWTVGVRFFGVLCQRAANSGETQLLAFSAAVGAMAVMAAGSWQGLAAQSTDAPGAPTLAAVRAINRGVVNALARDGSVRRAPKRVLLTFLGNEINIGTLSWTAAKAGAALDFSDMQFFEEWQATFNEVAIHEYILAARAPGWQAMPWLPSARFIPRAYEMFSEGDDFTRLENWTGPEGAEFCLFRNESLSDPFRGFTAQQGMLPIEGPYPQWSLGLVRWGVLPRTRLTLEAPADGAYRLLIDLRANTPGRTAAFRLDGREIHRHDFAGRVGFYEHLALKFDLTRGSHDLEIEYNGGDDADGRAVLYGRIQLLPAKTPLPPPAP
jgi:hypothetical protein